MDFHFCLPIKLAKQDWFPVSEYYSNPRPQPKQPTLSLSVYPPAVTHVPTFQTAREMTSRRCLPGRVNSAKKTCILLSEVEVQLGSVPPSNWRGQALIYLSGKSVSCCALQLLSICIDTNNLHVDINVVNQVQNQFK